jgi:hypothetical protein
MASFQRIPRAWCYATTGGVPGRSLVVAAVIGTVLNLINQGDALLEGTSVSWLKVALTYVVPYCVSTYGAVSYRMAMAEKADGDPPVGLK